MNRTDIARAIAEDLLDNGILDDMIRVHFLTMFRK